MDWIESTRPENTVRTYTPYAQEYLAYTRQKGLDWKSPVALASFMKYAAFDRTRRLGRATVCDTIPASVFHLFRYSDTSPHNSTLVREMRKAIARSIPCPKGGRLPLSVKLLRKIRNRVQPNVEMVRNFFLILLMFLAMLRASEAVSLRVEDVWVEDHGSGKILQVFVAKSKTDQESKGHTISLAEGQTKDLCPVKWFLTYQTFRDPEAVFLFYPIGGDLSRSLSVHTPNHIVKKAVEELGEDPDSFGSHSCRKGGCTTAFESGVDKRLVALHGRWRSNAINSYITDSTSTKLLVSKGILSQLEKDDSDSDTV